MSVKGKVVIRKSRRGNVVALAREHYLRDDIGCRTSLCGTCEDTPFGEAKGLLGSKSEVYLIPDASAVLNQHDVLLSGIEPFVEVLFLQTVLEETRASSGKIYDKVKEALVKGSDDANYAAFSNENHRSTYVERTKFLKNAEYRNDSIVRACCWLGERWKPIRKRAVLVTDTDLKDLIGSERVEVVSVEQLVEKYEAQNPRLRELFNSSRVEDGKEDDANGQEGPGRLLYPSYMPEADAKRKIRSGKLFQGVYSTNAYNLWEGFVAIAMNPKEPNKRTKVLLQGRNSINRAISGDAVVIAIDEKEQWKVPSKLALEEGDESEDEEKDEEERKTAQETRQLDGIQIVPTGKVVAVTKRNWRPYGGSIDALRYTSGDSALFTPAERSVPKIQIRSRRMSELLGKRLQVVIDGWDRASVHPRGHVIREIGSSGDVDTETEMLLLENDIPTRKFSVKAMDCLPPADWSIQDEDLKHRWDFRGKTICSVDPPGCTDIDDALHCEDKGDGTYEVGVHIADVTAFLRHASALDQEAMERGTTVYLVDRRIEMLPSLLTSNLCSLMGEVERYAFSVIFHMDKEGNQLGVKFGRSVILSKRAMTYQEAQERIDAHRRGTTYQKKVDEDIADSLCGLARIAGKLRSRRVEAGALSLASPEVKFQFDEESHEIKDVKTYEIRETNRMVEEFMLLANIAVATRLLSYFPSCAMLRRHPRPLPEHFDALVKTAKSFGVELDISSSKKLNESLNMAEKKFGGEDAYLGTLLRILATRCMTQAVYFSSGEVSSPEYVHYGLAAEVYTHFTSPIRRYADVIVHRLLSSSLGYTALPDELQKSAKIQEIADLINHRHRCAQYAARASITLHTTLFLKGKLVEEDGRVVRLLKNAVVVLVPKFGIEGIAYLDSEAGEGSIVLDEDNMVLTCPSGRKIKVMDTVRVRVSIDAKQATRDRVSFELLGQTKK